MTYDFDIWLRYYVLRYRVIEMVNKLKSYDEDNVKILLNHSDYAILDYCTIDPSKGHQFYGIEVLIANVKQPKIFKIR